MSKSKKSKKVKNQVSTNKFAGGAPQKPRAGWIIASIALLIVVAALAISLRSAKETALFREKAALLKNEVLSAEITGPMASGTPKNVVFLSLSDSTERASVFTGTGSSLRAAFRDAEKQARKFVRENDYEALWIKADVVTESRRLYRDEFSDELKGSREEFYRNGVSFDKNYETALLEAELNGAKIYDYEQYEIDYEYLNTYLRKAGRPKLKEESDRYVVFHTDCWFCGEDKEVYPLISEGNCYGRRDVETVDKDYALDLVKKASGFMADQVEEDGSFHYGMYPRFDNDIEGYNIVRHAGAIWSLICQYRVTGDEAVVPLIKSTIDYMLKDYVSYSDENTAYLVEKKSSEIKLGGCGIAVVALTEYMDAFGNEEYKDLAIKLGNGILTMFDEKDGTYFHVLNEDFTRKEAYRTVYYDGEATFALCRLYGLTGDEKWLRAAERAADHFIEAGYEEYRDHWIEYTFNELTTYSDKVEYYTFGLKNIQVNLDTIYKQDTTYHTYFEMLMAGFEIYDRMEERGIEVPYAETDFDLDYFLKVIYSRADYLLNGYFYPEYAMYMRNPLRIIDSFMVRHDGYRVRIDDVQHNVGGYYLYYLYYDKLVERGMLDVRDR
ncbi:MAG: glycosyl hydrolase family 88 [Clostridia bacterium]|nr:glycosyl hydrolase family 88 [Clostridia bacterium]